MTKGLILLCAGGTGGHLFPAEAVAHELKARGYTIHLAADDRVGQFSSSFPAEEIHHIKSATFGSKNPVAILKTLGTLFAGYMQCVKLNRKLKPVAVAGFGGYPTLPPLFAASMMGIPSLVHEANAVLGRANRVLAKRVNKVAMGFGETTHWSGLEVSVTGNPVRPDILEVAKEPYPNRASNEPFELLVFGGSQGAAFFSDCVPQSIALLSDAERSLLHVVQQARAEDKDAVIAHYAGLGVTATVDSFFTNMPENLAKSHMVISRAGASTVSELAVVGRPAILVPYPYALDHDQASNAALMAKTGGVTIHKQTDLTPEILSLELSKAISDPKKLALAAENAKKTGKSNATKVLADMLEALVQEKQN